ncbi:DUF2306 domain-containing protein [Phenylobacterium sp.]|uniref:DUF2306 domain-containing protein n=1 Tax=Phenylobacterium sp. TaxID=1871053 RepID=UPI003982FA9A
MNTKVSSGLWGLAALLSVAVAIVSYRYVPSVGPVPENVGANLFFNPWLAVHVGGAATALLVGPLQFLSKLRARRRGLHRWLGRTYVVACLVGGLSGLPLAYGASAGPIAAAGFGLLAVIWLYTTGQGWRLARARRFEEHRRWMIRSFALTFAAVTLRLYLPIAPVLGYDFMEGYRIIAWAAWVPNLLLAELYLMRGRAPARMQPAG